MTRFALCLSGFMRSFRQCLPSLRNSFLDRLPCDIYISTWGVLGHSHYKANSRFCGRLTTEESLTPQMLEETYGPRLKAYSIRPFDPQAILPAWLSGSLHARTASMYYHIYEANRLKTESGSAYAVTIRCRPDLLIESDLAGSLAEERLALWVNRPYTDRRVFIPAAESFHNLTNDQFMFGGTATMDLIANIYQAIATPQAFWCVDPAERTLDHYMAQHDIESTTLKIRYTRQS